MDPQFLERDEIQIELDVREQDISHPQPVELLASLVEQELEGIRHVPIRLHSTFRTVSSELAELRWKLSSIVIKTGDIEELARFRAKLLHIYGRWLRLGPNSGGNTQFSQLGKDIDASLKGCTNMLADRLETTSAEGTTSHDVETNQHKQFSMEAVDHSSKMDASDSASSERALVSSAAVEASVAASGSSQQVTDQVFSIDKAQSSQTGAQSSAASNRQADQHWQQKSLPPSPLLPLQTNKLPLPGHPSTSHVSSIPRFQGSMQIPTLVNQGPTTGNSAAQYQSVAVYPPASHLVNPGVVPVASSIDLPMQGNITQGWQMAKWQLRFGGGPKDLPVDEFVFRVETLARLSTLPQAALTLGLHQLLAGTAESWYWIFLRNQPNATWAQTRASLIRAFKANTSDAAIRRLIMDRLQRPGERFMEFQLAIQELEVRLSIRMSEQELLETLRRNMLPHIQDRLLFLPIYTVCDLQGRVLQVEELAQRQLEVQHLRRLVPRIHEIQTLPHLVDDYPIHSQNFSVPPPSFGVTHNWSNPFAEQMNLPDQFIQSQDIGGTICAIGAGEDQNQYLACWNCDELGHTYMDCTARRIIFCYGCGTKNVVRPQCIKCSLRDLQGNGRGSVRQNGNLQSQQRSCGQPLHRPVLPRRPQ